MPVDLSPSEAYNSPNMKVLTGGQMAEIDRQAIEELGMPVPVLMENAGRSVALAVAERVSRLRDRKILVVSGKGNNGGDGLVAARHLQNLGAEVRVFILGEPGALPPAPSTNAAILESMVQSGESKVGSGLEVEYLPDEPSLERLKGAVSEAEIIIDGLLGIGIKGGVRGYYAGAIELINRSAALVVAVDVPSGVEADTGHVEGPCVRAELTVTMALPKVGLLLYPGRGYVGELVVGEVGYPAALLDSYDSKLKLIDRDSVAGKLPPRQAYSHKGDYGRVFLLAGSPGYTGAAALASEAALRAGAGLVTLGIPEELNPIMEGKLTEVITRPLPDTGGCLASRGLEEIEGFLENQDAMVIGPGIARHPETGRLVRELVRRAKLPLVIDADGLNNLSEEPEVWRDLQAPAILTPHPGELSRLAGKGVREIERDRVGAAREMATEFGVILVLKGVPTIVALPSGRAFMNSTGNSGLASGGSGDVLTGLIGGLLGQGVDPAEAAICAVYLHGLIADRLKERKGERGMIAGDLLAAMPEVLREFE